MEYYIELIRTICSVAIMILRHPNIWRRFLFPRQSFFVTQKGEKYKYCDGIALWSCWCGCHEIYPYYLCWRHALKDSKYCEKFPAFAWGRIKSCEYRGNEHKF